MKLKDQVAIVTAGAGAGIGQAIVRRLAEEGAHVVISDAHAKRPLDLAQELNRQHGREFIDSKGDSSQFAGLVAEPRKLCARRLDRVVSPVFD